MRPIFKLVLLLAASLPLLAIDGVVTNATTNMPQAGVAITLVQPSQNGMVRWRREDRCARAVQNR